MDDATEDHHHLDIVLKQLRPALLDSLRRLASASAAQQQQQLNDKDLADLSRDLETLKAKAAAAAAHVAANPHLGRSRDTLNAELDRQSHVLNAKQAQLDSYMALPIFQRLLSVGEKELVEAKVIAVSGHDDPMQTSTDDR